MNAPREQTVFLIGACFGLALGMYITTVGAPRPTESPEWADEKSLHDLRFKLWNNAHAARIEMPKLAEAYREAARKLLVVECRIRAEDAQNEYEMPVAERLEQTRKEQR